MTKSDLIELVSNKLHLPKGKAELIVNCIFDSMEDSLKHGERTFATAEASKLLVEQGIKVSNPSQSLKNNMDGKKLFRVGNRFKISREGQDRVNDLLGRS